MNNLYCNSIVNIPGDEAIIIKISGDCILEGNTVDNFGIKLSCAALRQDW